MEGVAACQRTRRAARAARRCGAPRPPRAARSAAPARRRARRGPPRAARGRAGRPARRARRPRPPRAAAGPGAARAAARRPGLGVLADTSSVSGGSARGELLGREDRVGQQRRLRIARPPPPRPRTARRAAHRAAPRPARARRPPPRTAPASVGTAATGRARRTRSAFSVARPMRSPVNEPGPIETAKAPTVVERDAREREQPVDAPAAAARSGPARRRSLISAIARSPSSSATLITRVAVSTARRSGGGLRGSGANRRSSSSTCDTSFQKAKPIRPTSSSRPTCCTHSRARSGSGPAPQRLDREEQRLAAVEDRDRQQVQDAEVDADDHEQRDEALPAALERELRLARDLDRPADRAARDVARHDPAQPVEERAGRLDRDADRARHGDEADCARGRSRWRRAGSRSPRRCRSGTAPADPRAWPCRGAARA